ncbi:alpha/beta hydrolase [Massilia yuzhufengensis]|uniref:Serine aminopeptidase S33 domain-containing protein n=1 Tax=Massilia yuzhufengensis TaxID=1164594 RepID=A0A1I1QF37_9BURK|nr:alpha/beta hydrolase [Massilia yuzhufengensis]SFD20617.1 hypothetical protein SAMN05216204_1195 [Massilia yuzhufengensis]
MPRTPATVFLCAFFLAASVVAAPRESAIALENSGVIAGTLALPEGAAPTPVVLLIAGSGPTDRNGNNPAMQNNSLQGLAHALAASGIASLRYDKRGIAASREAGGREADLTLDRYADDAAAWVRLLRKDARFGKIVIVGHSEGSLIGMLGAQRGGADAFVSLAGPGERLSVVLRRQLAGKLPPDLMKDSERILSALEQGQLAGDVPPMLAALYRPSVQPYLVSCFKYDPAQELGKLRIPVAVIQGSTDLQVGVDDARKLHQARPGAPLVIVKGMNHVLKMVEGDLAAQLPSYSNPSLPVAEALVTELAGFVKGVVQ